MLFNCLKFVFYLFDLIFCAFDNGKMKYDEKYIMSKILKYFLIALHYGRLKKLLLNLAKIIIYKSKAKQIFYNH